MRSTYGKQLRHGYVTLSQVGDAIDLTYISEPMSYGRHAFKCASESGDELVAWCAETLGIRPIDVMKSIWGPNDILGIWPGITQCRLYRA